VVVLVLLGQILGLPHGEKKMQAARDESRLNPII